jgi:hypothetical protein
VQQLESSKLKLASLEQELQKARQQVYVYFVDVEMGYLDKCFFLFDMLLAETLNFVTGILYCREFSFPALEIKLIL